MKTLAQKRSRILSEWVNPEYARLRLKPETTGYGNGKGNPNGGAHFRDRTACGNDHPYVNGSWTWAKGGKFRICKICKRESVLRNYVPKARVLRTHCVNGHAFTEENTGSYGSGHKQVCRRCAMLGMQKSRGKISAEEYAAILAADYEATHGADGDALKSHPLDRLKLTPEQGIAQTGVDQATDLYGRPRCESDPDAYTDFDHDTVPTKDYAKEMCADCPILVACRARMKAGLGYHHVSVGAGSVWVDDIEQVA